MISLFEKQTTFWGRSSVLSLPLQLVFPGVTLISRLQLGLLLNALAKIVLDDAKASYITY